MIHQPPSPPFPPFPGGGPKGYAVWNHPQFYRPTNFWYGGWTDPFGCVWRNGLYIASITVNSIALFGWWSGGCCGCGQYYYNEGNSYCGPCTFWNGYQCVGMDQWPGWNGQGGQCYNDNCQPCYYFDPSYGYCIQAPQCGS